LEATDRGQASTGEIAKRNDEAGIHIIVARGMIPMIESGKAFSRKLGESGGFVPTDP
jgi:hypothetical protein